MARTFRGNPLAASRAPSYCAAVDQTQLQQYVPVLMLGLLAVIFTGGMLVGSALLGFRGGHNRAKDTPWECGIIPTGGGGTRLGVRFYLVAMLFILFDIEVVFLYPWAVVYQEMLRDPATKDLILFAMLSFLGVLFIGYFYALKKRAFDWKS